MLATHKGGGVVSVDKAQIDAVVAFHGHICPGIATGIRVAEAALQHVGRASQDEEVVAVCETDNCALDAIQYLVGCTAGKGNLIVERYGRNRFTFARRSDGLAIRVTARPRRPGTPEQEALVSRVRSGTAMGDDHAHFNALWQERAAAILAAPLGAVVDAERLDGYILPPKAVIEPSLTCSRCGLAVMASLTRQLDGEVICQACWQEAGSRSVHLNQIGVVKSEKPEGQSHAEARAAVAEIELLPLFAKSLTGLQPHQMLQVLWLIDRANRSFEQLQHPKGDAALPRRGIMALRTPNRPSPLGLTTVELLDIQGLTLTVKGLDAWDGSPVLDIKPYAPLWDDRP